MVTVRCVSLLVSVHFDYVIRTYVTCAWFRKCVLYSYVWPYLLLSAVKYGCARSIIGTCIPQHVVYKRLHVSLLCLSHGLWCSRVAICPRRYIYCLYTFQGFWYICQHHYGIIYVSAVRSNRCIPSSFVVVESASWVQSFLHSTVNNLYFRSVRLNIF